MVLTIKERIWKTFTIFIGEFINNTSAKNAVKSDSTIISADYNTRKAT